MHIDAFFEYILNKPHVYYQQIPSSLPPDSSDQMRDGVPIEEDLALRALLPETRPKRGRRKGDDKDDGSEKDAPAPKRPHIDTGTPLAAGPASAIERLGNSLFPPHPQSAVPSSAGGDDMIDRFFEETDPWTAATQSVLSGGSATPIGAQQFRWRAFPRDATTPQTPHPPPTILTSHDRTTTTHDEVQTPVSATTPISGSKPRSRRRHGPAVSSAWPGSGNPLTGKIRGRPPNNRSVRDGPFSTFPAHPMGKGHITIDYSPGAITATPTSTPVTSHPPQQYTFKPQQLHLTVPTRTGGGAITMASPASAISPSPRLNGNSRKREKSPLGKDTISASATSELGDIERKFSLGLLQAQGENGLVVGVEDSQRIAEKIVASLKRAWPDEDSAGGSDKLIAALTGFGDHSAFREVKISRLAGPPSERNGLDDLGLGVSGDLSGRGGGAERRFDVRWSIQFGPVRGEFSQVVSVGGVANQHDYTTNSGPSQLGEEDDRALEEGLERFDGANNQAPAASVETLKKKVLELERSLRAKDKQLNGIRENVLKAVM